MGLLREYFGDESRLARASEKAYSRDQVRHWRDSGSCPLLGARLLVHRAGVRRFIVNSRSAAECLRSDLGDDASKVVIEELFLPVLPVRQPLPERVPLKMYYDHLHEQIPGTWIKPHGGPE